MMLPDEPEYLRGHHKLDSLAGYINYLFCHHKLELFIWIDRSATAVSRRSFLVMFHFSFSQQGNRHLR